MKRLLFATTLAVIASTAFAGTAHAAPVSPLGKEAAMSSRSADDVFNGIENGWQLAYEGLPAEARYVVPEHMRPEHPDVVKVEPKMPAQIQSPVPVRCFNCVAVTYDDGPGPDTARLLDILKDKGAKASFFLIGGSVDYDPDTVRRIRDEGHTIGNHSYTHPQLSALSAEGVASELDQTTEAIGKASSVQPQWLRPPYGATNDNVAAVSGQRGMALAMWDVDTLDWQNRNAGITCSSAVEGAQSGSIVLLHDIHPSSVDATACIIDGLRAKGLRPVSLEELVSHPAAGRTYTTADS